MKKIIYLITGLLIGLLGGYLLKSTIHSDIHPKMQQYLQLTFGTSNPAAVSGEDAELMIKELKEFLDYQVQAHSIWWEVHAICKLKELDASREPEPADAYLQRTLTYFFKHYHEKEYSEGYDKFADKLYRDLTSDKAKLNYTIYESERAKVQKQE